MPGISSFFGGGPDKFDPDDLPLAGFRGGGLRGEFKDGTFRVTSNKKRKGTLRDQQLAFQREVKRVRHLRRKVKPGFSRFRKAGLQQIAQRRRVTVGNLRDNLARRRVLGSSFAGDAIARTEREFADSAANFSASTFLKELDVSSQLAGRIGELRRGKVQATLKEANLKATFSAEFASQIQSLLVQAQLAQQGASASAASGFGQLLGTLGGAAILSNPVTSFFSPAAEVPATVVGPIL